MSRLLLLLLLILPYSVVPAADMSSANEALSRGDYATAFAAFLKLAEQGNAKAQSHLGYMYYAGEGVAQSYEDAVYWYQKAATQGDRDAQYNIAVAYAFGEGVEKDLREAAVWYRRAAEQGHAIAQYSLGISYAYGEGVKQDGALAARWFLQSAEQDYEASQVMIASIYHTGDGIPRDYQAAAYWYRKAAEKNNAIAQYNLGTLYRAGKGVTKNNAIARRWFTRAAEQGYAAAQKELLAMQQAVTVAPPAQRTADEAETDDAKIDDTATDEPVAEKTTVTAPSPSGDIVLSPRRGADLGGSREALITLKKEDLLTLKQEPETEPLATVDEIAKPEYQPEEGTKAVAETKPATTTTPAAATPDTGTQQSGETDAVTEAPATVAKTIDSSEEAPAASEEPAADNSSESGGVLGFFKQIFTAEKDTSEPEIKSTPAATPYVPLPTPAPETEPGPAVAEETPEQETVIAKADTEPAPQPDSEQPDDEDWGRPTFRAPDDPAVTYADGDSPAKQQLRESWEESRTAEITRIEEPPGPEETVALAEEPVTPDPTATTEAAESAAVPAAGTGVENDDSSGGIGGFFKRLFGGDDTGTDTDDAEPAIAESSMDTVPDEPETVPEDDNESVRIATAEPVTTDVPIAESAETDQGAMPSLDALLGRAVEGDVDAQFQLAKFYQTGDQVEQDPEQAFIWYRRAASQGNREAQFNLGNMYLLGEGISQNDAKARQWFARAADQGHAGAADNLENLGQLPDAEPSGETTLAAVQQTDDAASASTSAPVTVIETSSSPARAPGEEDYQRGMAYYYGEGVPTDYVTAFRYFRHAAGEGYVPAQYRLGVAFANGEGTEQDAEAALEWYQKAAKQGYPIAQRSLCKMYLDGQGVDQDRARALAWYNILADQGNVMDTHRRDRLVQELNETEIARAEKLTREISAGITTASSNF